MTGDPVTVAEFLRAGGRPDASCDVRRIGTDANMVRLIIERIATGEKTMTYSLPWLREHTGQPDPAPGLLVVALDAAGAPALLLELTRIKHLSFGEVTEADIAEEGIPMRDIKAWRPLHTTVWNEKLAPLGRSVSDDMPVTAEYFKLIYGQDR